MSFERRSARRNDWRLRIRDILGAIAEIELFVAGMDFATFRDDVKTMRAVAYDFVVLGEAARNVPDDVQERHASIPWALMRGMRNVVAH